jgi:hypothetical protein
LFSFQAKLHQRAAAERERILPFIHSESDLTNLVHKHESLTHSATEMNLSQNGYIHNNFLFENVNNNYENVTLIPVPHNDYTEESPKELHSRGHHVFDI